MLTPASCAHCLRPPGKKGGRDFLLSLDFLHSLWMPCFLFPTMHPFFVVHLRPFYLHPPSRFALLLSALHPPHPACSQAVQVLPHPKPEENSPQGLTGNRPTVAVHPLVALSFFHPSAPVGPPVAPPLAAPLARCCFPKPHVQYSVFIVDSMIAELETTAPGKKKGRSNYGHPCEENRPN
jgi:hypothetical protein